MTSTTDTRPSIAATLTPDTRFGRADLHVETDRGEGESSLETILERIERRAELDVVAIADRDQIESSLEAREIVARERLGFEVLPGLLVTTADGPILALWIEQSVAPNQPADVTISAIHEAGGLAIVVHPFARWRRSIGQNVLEGLLAHDDPSARPDAIQLASGSARASSGADRALELNASRYQLAEVGASNAVFAERIASAYTLFPGTLRPGLRTSELRVAIENRTAQPVRGRRTPLRQLGWRRVAEQRAREARSATERRIAPLIGWPAPGGTR